MRRFIHILLSLLALVVFTACEGEECAEAKTVEKIEERNTERLDEILDKADAYENQRKTMRDLTNELKGDRVTLTRMRESARDLVLGELLKDKPDPKAMHKAIDDAKRAMMPLNYKVLDQVMVGHPAFTTAQRKKMTKKIHEKPDPFELTFIMRTGIDYVLFKIDATDGQKKTIWGEINQTSVEVNQMITRQHKIAVTLATEWEKKDADSVALKKNVDVSANGFTAFIKKLATKAASMTDVLTPEQRTYTNDRVRRGLTCK